MRYYKLFPNATLYIIDSEAFMQKTCALFEFCEYTFGSVYLGSLTIPSIIMLTKIHSRVHELTYVGVLLLSAIN